MDKIPDTEENWESRKLGCSEQHVRKSKERIVVKDVSITIGGIPIAATHYSGDIASNPNFYKRGIHNDKKAWFVFDEDSGLWIFSRFNDPLWLKELNF
ncbi:MAG: hypothetical protein K0U78_14950 [Actinomycetia bacterium]|nr:hypothetical protein [Actinomycetes bacterium]